MRLAIFNRPDCPSVNKGKIVKIIKRVLREEKYELQSLNVVIERNNYLRKLNKIFFRKDRATNVISFNMEEVSEIYISCDKVKYPDDLYYYIVHGLLHIIGYDHRDKKGEKEMRKKCLRYISHA